MSLCSVTSLANTPRAFVLNNTIYDGVSTAFTSTNDPAFTFDGPKILPSPNASSYEWWYFDAVGSAATPGSVALIFFSAPQTAFPFVGDINGGTLAVYVSASLPNGTIIGTEGVANVSYVLPEKDWSSGDYGSLGGWCGTDAGNVVNVNVTGFVGSLTLKKSAPAHVACGTLSQTADLTSSPNIYWSNSVPAATASANFVFGDGSKFVFDGYGNTTTKTGVGEYWGHATFGPFSIVWSLVIGVDGKNYTSGYVSRDGTILSSSCQPLDFSLAIQGGATFPPTITTQIKTSSYGLSFVLSNGAGNLDVVLDKLAIVMLGGSGVFVRWTGAAKGGLRGGDVYEGVAVSESFAVLPGSPTATDIPTTTTNVSTVPQTTKGIQGNGATDFSGLGLFTLAIILLTC
ncbi:hypothetical protein BCR33DRAFT_721870 [Rhizoclosmatium globosum]|uniref:Uncharacterized protein n=1 Tax=Rhizoclosmatium globosum TaxID=329046 RepID=A0A1Y2BPI6_9FUNG|nr:hypothetical protein BCR33DRAFT_721870 [Rhizoclosmatium globosum]|eukprot:ORY36652.1 hypothetical protein BCR33DRAFT_721870 [Rhizoclosmatium globosum]